MSATAGAARRAPRRPFRVVALASAAEFDRGFSALQTHVRARGRRCRRRSPETELSRLIAPFAVVNATSALQRASLGVALTRRQAQRGRDGASRLRAREVASSPTRTALRPRAGRGGRSEARAAQRARHRTAIAPRPSDRRAPGCSRPRRARRRPSPRPLNRAPSLRARRRRWPWSRRWARGAPVDAWAPFESARRAAALYPAADCGRARRRTTSSFCATTRGSRRCSTGRRCRAAARMPPQRVGRPSRRSPPRKPRRVRAPRRATFVASCAVGGFERRRTAALPPSSRRRRTDGRVGDANRAAAHDRQGVCDVKPMKIVPCSCSRARALRRVPSASSSTSAWVAAPSASR